MMNFRQFFPLGKAYGEAFCNRVNEVAWLADNLKAAKHSLLIAPRRYGKSSLAERAITQSKLPAVSINFHLCTTEREVAELIANTVAKAIGLTLGRFEKLLNSIKKYVSHLNPKLSIGKNLVTLELMPQDVTTNPALLITESLLLLDKLLREKKKQAVLFFDEFQEITRLPQSALIEGAIRTAAQEMQNVTIIFSGSIRSILLSMFEQEDKPLYKLCRKLKLPRISASDYKKHINKAAKKTWKQFFPVDALDLIMQLTHRHPYYVNYLCDAIWQSTTRLPTQADVQAAWRNVIEEEWSDALKEISLLSLAQRKLLKFIATQHNKNLASQENCRQLMMPASTISSSLEALVDRDYIEKDEDNNYEIINPLLLTVLKNF